MAVRMTLILLVVVAANLNLAHCFRKRCERVVTINPPTLFDPLPFGYQHISVDTLNAVAHIAGQVAIDVNGNVVGTTLAEQLTEVEKNLRLALDAVNADTNDILRLNGFILNFTPAQLPTFQDFGRNLASPVSTVVATGSLALNGLLVEVEIDVAVPRKFARRVGCRKSQRGI